MKIELAEIRAVIKSRVEREEKKEHLQDWYLIGYTTAAQDIIWDLLERPTISGSNEKRRRN